jgi:hypothetical protein
MSLSFVCKTKFLAKVLLWLAVSEYGVSEYGVSPASLSKKNCKFKKKPQKGKKRSRTLCGVYTLAEDTLVRLGELQSIKNFLAYLKKKVYSNNYRPKYVKYLMIKIRKELKFIETTEICKAMKEPPTKTRKTHKLGVTSFASNVFII